MKKPLVISLALHGALIGVLLAAQVQAPAAPQGRTVRLVAVEVVPRPAEEDPPANVETARVAVVKGRPPRAKEPQAAQAPPPAAQPARAQAAGGAADTGGTTGAGGAAGTMTVAAVTPGGGAQATAPGPATAGGQTGGGGGADGHAADYRAIRDAIDRVARRSYPLQARRLGIKGVVTVRFTVGPDGAAKGLSIVAGSGFDLLDEAARAIVVKAGPYPAVPEPVQIPIRFSLEAAR